MSARQPSPRRRTSFWLLVAGLAAFLSLEPGFFLVALAVALSLLTVTWIVMLIRVLLLDALGHGHWTWHERIH